jgi:hypothetical protein
VTVTEIYGRPPTLGELEDLCEFVDACEEAEIATREARTKRGKGAP